LVIKSFFFICTNTTLKEIHAFYAFCSLDKVKKNRLQGYTDRQGKKTIPIQFKATWNFRYELAAACHTQSKWIHPPEKQVANGMAEPHEEGSAFRHKLAKIQLRGATACIDASDSQLSLKHS